MEDLKTLSFVSKFSKPEVFNSQFHKVKIYVAYAGKNRNMSTISKDTFEKIIPSIYGIPIVGEWKGSDFGTHGGKIEITDDSITYTETTKPYGYIDSTAEVGWEMVTEEDGIEREYLYTTGFLWTSRYPEALNALDGDNNQSMELNIFDGFSTEDDYFEITDAEFSALCILGEKTEPCFESANVKQFNLDKETFKEEFSLMVKELKESTNDIPAEGGEKEEMSKPIIFELSHDDIRAKIFDILNPRDEDEYRIWNYWIMKVYDDYLIVEDENTTENYYKIPYSISENDEIVLGDKVQVFFEFLLQDEKDALDEMRNNYSVLEAEVKELREYKDEKEKIEYEAQLEQERQGKIDHINSEYESVSEEIKQEFINKIDEYTSTKDIDADMCIYIVKNKLDFSKANFNSTGKIGVDGQHQEPKFSPYGELSDKFNK